MTEKEMQGRFWIEDLKKVLREEGIFDEEHEEQKFDRSLFLPSRSRLSRWLDSEDPNHSFSYCGPVIVDLKVYYDNSGRDVSVRNNQWLPEDFPMMDHLSARLAAENGVMFGDDFYGSDEPTNDLEKVRSYIRGIRESKEKIETCAKRLTDKLYELATE